jgi:hypothetical protein
MNKLERRSTLCMRCLQAAMSEEHKENHNHEFNFYKGKCINCEDLTMVTELNHKDSLGLKSMAIRKNIELPTQL